ncbi:unnamed protein product [Chrysoparadoxa australica]
MVKKDEGRAAGKGIQSGISVEQLKKMTAMRMAKTINCHRSPPPRGDPGRRSTSRSPSHSPGPSRRSPKASAAPVHGLTVDELKALTKMRLEREGPNAVGMPDTNQLRGRARSRSRGRSPGPHHTESPNTSPAPGPGAMGNSHTHRNSHSHTGTSYSPLRAPYDFSPTPMGRNPSHSHPTHPTHHHAYSSPGARSLSPTPHSHAGGMGQAPSASHFYTSNKQMEEALQAAFQLGRMSIESGAAQTNTNNGPAPVAPRPFLAPPGFEPQVQTSPRAFEADGDMATSPWDAPLDTVAFTAVDEEETHVAGYLGAGSMEQQFSSAPGGTLTRLTSVEGSPEAPSALTKESWPMRQSSDPVSSVSSASNSMAMPRHSVSFGLEDTWGDFKRPKAASDSKAASSSYGKSYDNKSWEMPPGKEQLGSPMDLNTVSPYLQHKGSMREQLLSRSLSKSSMADLEEEISFQVAEYVLLTPRGSQAQLTQPETSVPAEPTTGTGMSPGHKRQLSERSSASNTEVPRSLIVGDGVTLGEQQDFFRGPLSPGLMSPTSQQRASLRSVSTLGFGSNSAAASLNASPRFPIATAKSGNSRESFFNYPSDDTHQNENFKALFHHGVESSLLGAAADRLKLIAEVSSENTSPAKSSLGFSPASRSPAPGATSKLWPVLGRSKNNSPTAMHSNEQQQQQQKQQQDQGEDVKVGSTKDLHRPMSNATLLVREPELEGSCYSIAMYSMQSV